MRSRIKCAVAMVLSLAFMLAGIMPDVYAVEPRYTYIYRVDCHLDVYDGVAQCRSKVVGESDDHIYEIHMVLYQDDEDYAEWDASGRSVVALNQTYYVTIGHEYYVGVHVKVYDLNGNFVEQAVLYSGTYEYFEY